MTDSSQLHGKKIAIVVTNYGIEQDELVRPRQAVIDAGGQAVIVAVEQGDVATLVGDKDPGATLAADLTISAADAADFDALIIPGGTINADSLRLENDAIAFVSDFVEAGKPIAAICHGPWALVETGRVSGKTLTSYASLRTDLTNAGATWVDESVHVDREAGWTLVTSRDPDDLDDFTRELVTAFAAA
ncbi:type 1 glutamine amidotransferase domain-containing protein [Schumannella luteola]|uniref:Protease I n=1 Tax=Schumannella luteola TaxID=472059 RepID=A0A852YHK6_9MICO|nr:DJ-1/PfpI/YhbO family deglycase/protease [Schumannella luteola]NYH00761.1 protease I [Schumannella luteola]TPX03971.1 DJ-1/PfpI/YhbO family deglycase/protease [Schumannella luteola]